MNKKIIIFIVILLIAIFIAGIWWVLYLRKAHSNFDDYFAFRGCAKLIERQSDYGTCQVKSGETIKIVKYQDRWYLDGDLP